MPRCNFSPGLSSSASSAAGVFTWWPEIDLAISRWFNIGTRLFLLDPAIAPVTSALRKFFEVGSWTVGVVALIAVITAVAAKRYLFGLGGVQWLFLALVLLIGPTFLVNGFVKNYSARPRPIHLVEFGGPHAFTPVFRSGQCHRNCSFVSGEASSVYALGFAIAMMARRRRATLMGFSHSRRQRDRLHSHRPRRPFPERHHLCRRIDGNGRCAHALAGVSPSRAWLCSREHGPQSSPWCSMMSLRCAINFGGDSGARWRNRAVRNPACRSGRTSHQDET